MNPHIDDLPLIELTVEGHHDPHLDLCSRCRHTSDEINEALHLLAFTLPPAVPPRELGVRIFAAIAGPVSEHSSVLAKMFDCPEAALRALCRRIDRGVLAWAPVLPGIQRHNVIAAPGRECGLFHVAPGALFPHHRHLGEERMRILQGSCSDTLGVVLGPGDEHTFPAGTAHAVLAHDGPPLILAYVSRGTEFTAAAPPCDEG